MMEAYDDDDDDTHFCIKCNSTIHGLENYVRHRQSGCRVKTEAHDAPSTPTTVSYPEILNADAFFNSLELQSSSKSNSRRTTSGDRSRKSGRNEDRKRKNQKDKSPEDTSKDKLHNLLPVVTDLDDPTDHLGIPSLVGFPDIVATSKPSTSVKISLVSSIKIEPSDFHGKHDSLESVISKQLDRKRDDPQRLDPDHPGWLDDSLLVDLVGNPVNKDASSLSRFEDFDYQQEEEMEEESGEEYVEEDESFSESDDEDRSYPPLSHTGGKWKPGLGSMSQTISHDLHEDDIEMTNEDEQEQHHHPPPSHTGGKWKPTESNSMDDIELMEHKMDIDQPPLGHTRGKWVPGARADISSGYWCSPCGRNLASRVLYNRHLRSDLHARRNMQEIDGVVQFPQSVNRKTKLQERAENNEENSNDGQQIVKKQIRKREKEILTCEMCCARVRRPQMGKHLLSHYHCRVAGANPFRAKAQQFLLENMENVVRQCPFQCSPCKFYCNTEDTFLLHWRSSLHLSIISKIDGSFKCAPCAFWCDENSSMESHLLSSCHRDLISMMNGSIPTVISRQRSLMCITCEQSFRYNIELCQHAKSTGHEVNYTASDEYQKRIGCQLCDVVFRSLVALQRHQLTFHKSESNKNPELDLVPYYCSFCSLSFKTTEDAIMHRRTLAHKEIVKSTKADNPSVSRECLNCNKHLSSLSELRTHLLEVHPELCFRCPKCAKIFALSQDVSRHTKEGECNPREIPNILNDTVEWKCNICPFATDLQSEFMFHEALHAGPVEPKIGEAGSSKTCVNYRCTLCKKCYSKATLRNHIRGHTGERPFPCSKCSHSFSRRNDLNIHRKTCRQISQNDKSNRQRNFSCAECSSAFFTKHALRQHMMRHNGKQYKCGLPGCITSLRTEAELKNHQLRVHGSPEQIYQCSYCSYTAKLRWQLARHEKKHRPPDDVNVKQHACPFGGCQFRAVSTGHIKRHVRTIHTNEKPYKCRYCTYASSTLENLRKHILSTTLHIGKTIYECDVCKEKGLDPYCTNFAKELKAHFIEEHSDEFPSMEIINNYVTNFFDFVHE
ncbi:zinc finger protein 160-like [Leptopilina boulardi]|uniref:zinc finger protein 160-like n=1 Tax=Leptopilina boulardi TaxID=63433 RepID=UPI0021F68B85|nr:zinc finger protein 160-like [Leptopilina boulardi]XP_051157084.1 zinc finger protein 160-like [Leptopilina boulardi]XP_051157085.1 zinc finger protein 160-like [Leptopilina boulardi]XP_051157086.1 zinc finger protein 160-like [Leptopilina boulardi]